MIKITSEDIGKLKDGTVIKIHDKYIHDMSGAYIKEGNILRGSRWGYHVRDIDGVHVIAYRDTVPKEEMERCINTFNIKRIVMPRHIERLNDEKRNEFLARIKRDLVVEASLSVMEAGYMTEGYSIRYEWNIDTEPSMTMYNEPALEYKLTAYVIKDKEE